MFLRCCLLIALVFPISGRAAELSYDDLNAPPHLYRQRTPRDRFTQLKADLESGRVALDLSSEKACLLSILAALGVLASSQSLVFSTTSLQLRLISPARPRALF